MKETNRHTQKELEPCWKRTDPFGCEIAPALLSQIEIERYVSEFPLVKPFDKSRLKPASYEGRIGKNAFIYNENGRRQEIQTAKCSNGFLEIPKMSIVYVESDIEFNLPYYIGLRFNLRIRHIHRGLLLGTGPLIDPGYHGKILIPLHNLTSEPYHISVDEGLFWVEFSKTTYLAENDPKREVNAPPRWAVGESEDWIDRASKDPKTGMSVPIQSSISVESERIFKIANKSKKIASNTRNFVMGFGFLSITVAGLGLVYFLTNFVQNTYGQINISRAHMQASLDKYEKKLSTVDSRMGELAIENAHLNEELAGIRQKNEILQRQILAFTDNYPKP
tara:strand:+ start:403 stop:1407 length:1005 start_codon:yes stop_codon:yes gene_type:complete